MPIKDSSFTNPDALRLLYLNPRNPGREAETVIAAQPGALQPPPPEIILPDPPNSCPAMSDYVLACVGILNPKPQPMPVRVLKEGMRLWNPIAKRFGVVAYAR